VFYVIVAEEELHNFLFFLMNVEHNASISGGYRSSVALNDLCLALLLGNSLLSEHAFAEVFDSFIMCHSVSLQAVS
jgi:hypothetical protein